MKQKMLSSITILLALPLICFTFLTLAQSTVATLETDEIFFKRYFTWFGDCLHLDFGMSQINTEVSVNNILLQSTPYTVKLIALSLIIVLAISIPIGAMCAVHSDFANIFKYIASLLSTIPIYWLGLILSLSFYAKESMLVLPALTIALGHIPIWIKFTKDTFSQALSQDYVLYDKARGLSNYKVWLHIWSNCVPAFVAALHKSIAQLILAVIIVENIFFVPGLGSLFLKAWINQDFPVIQAFVLLIGVVGVVATLGFELLENYLTRNV